MNKIKSIIIIVLLFIKLSIIILTNIFLIFWSIKGIKDFANLNLWKEIIENIIKTKLFLILVIIIWIWKYFQKKGWLYNISTLLIALIWYYLYFIKKSINIFKTKLFSRENLKFMLVPFYWQIYFDLSKMDKKLLGEKSIKIINIITKLNSYFSFLKLQNMKVIDYKIKGNSIELKIYRWNIEAWKIKRIENDDILNAINLSLNRYSLEKEIKNDLKIKITEKINNKTYYLKNYVNNFQKNTLHFWFDSMWNEIKYKLDFTKANHFWVYWKTGFWKTNFTSSLAYGLYLNNPNYNFIIIDPKWDFVHFEWLDRVEYAHEIEDIYKLLQRVKNNMKSIWDVFRQHKVRNFKEYQDVVKDKSDLVKPTFVFVEEFSKLINEVSDKSIKEEIISIIRELAIAWRSFCYNMIFSLQVPLKKVINDSEISRMLTPISFSIENSMNHHIFWVTIEQNLENLSIWEWVIKKWYNVEKFKAFYVDKESLDSLSKNYPKKIISIEEKYLSYAKNINSFSKKEALEFWLNRNEFDKLSKELQNKWVLKKHPNNSLYFISK